MNILTLTQEHDLLIAASQLVKACNDAATQNKAESLFVRAKRQNLERLLHQIIPTMNTDIDTNAENPHSTFASQLDDFINLLEICHHQASRAGHAALDVGYRNDARELFASSGRLKGMVQEWDKEFERIVKQ